MEFEKIAAELYALDPDEYVAARDARVAEARKAKLAGLAKELKALGKPTLTAWLVNQLMRHKPHEVERLLRVGEGLREAQEQLDGPRIRELSGERRGLLQSLGREGRALAEDLGHPVSDSVEQELQATLGAAVADPGVAAQVRAGRLTKALRHSGFGDLESLVLQSPPVRVRAPREDPGKAEREAERERLQAERERLQAALVVAEEAVDSATRESEEAAAEVERLRAELAGAERRRDRARDAVQAAEAERDEVRERLDAASDSSQ